MIASEASEFFFFLTFCVFDFWYFALKISLPVNKKKYF